MFIKIGNFIINSNNILRIWKDDMGIDLDFNVHDEGNAEPFRMRITVHDPYHPEALAAYDWFCKAAIRFDDVGTPAEQTTMEHMLTDFQITALRRVSNASVLTDGMPSAVKQAYLDLEDLGYVQLSDSCTEYSITAEGRIALSAYTYAPVTESVDDGGVWTHHTTLNGYIVRNRTHAYDLHGVGHTINLVSVLNNYRERIKEVEDKAQATALSALNVTTRFEQSAMNAQGEIDKLKSRLQKELNHIVNLEYVINHAFKELRTYDGDSGAVIAVKLMLEPYTTPESTED